jgi:3-deoxy-7-phosphoheptulonate synthase
MLSVSHQHRFLGINKSGEVSIVSTTGNPYGHIVLRGGGGKPNYSAENIAEAEAALASKDLVANIIVDCSHENSSKKPENQPAVLADIMQQIENGNESIIGVMLESHLHAGNQKIPENLEDLTYGVSITDGCIDWATTEKCLTQAAEVLANTRS